MALLMRLRAAQLPLSKPPIKSLGALQIGPAAAPIDNFR